MERTIKALIGLVLSPLVLLLILFFEETPVNLRLPTHILPQTYNITIRPFMEKEDGDLQYTFCGEVHIQIKPLIETKLLVLHSKELNYTLINYWALDKPYAKQRLKTLRYDYETDRLIFNLNNALQSKKIYNLHFEYTGLVNENIVGVFRNEYQDENNVSRWLIGTQLEPAEARRVFPCFDEPKFKANFILNILRPTHMKSYSNTKRLCSYVKGNLTLDVFVMTPKMSTYTFAFLITSMTERTDKSYGVLSLPRDFSYTKYNFEIGRKILTTLGNYLNLSYYEMGINKLHFAAVINLSFNAMENWGLVLSKRYGVVYNENSKNIKEKADITKLIAHELTHMWFGNLVTCEWWSYVWLNEAFATYFQYFGPAMLNNGSDYEKWESLFVLTLMQNCLHHNAKDDAISLNIYKNNAKRSTYFTPVVYSKGGTFIRMVKGVLGEKNFSASLQLYLKTFKYQTVKPKDLFTIWQKYSPAKFKLDFLEFCYSYTEKPGYPLITIKIAENGQSIEIHQQRFRQNFDIRLKTTIIYSVPISFTTDVELNFTQTAPFIYLTRKFLTMKLPTEKPIKWLIANIQATGLYRVNYNEKNWHQIGEALMAENFSGIPILNRMQIVNDVQNLFCAGVLNQEIMLKVLNFLHNEIRYEVWKTAIDGFQKMLPHLTHEFYDFKFYMKNITTKVYAVLGFLDKLTDDDFILNNRKQIIPLACKFGNENCIANAVNYLKDLEALQKLNFEQQFLVYCTAIREGNDAIYEHYYNLYTNSIEDKEKRFIIHTLGCVRDPDLMQKHFSNIIYRVQQVHKNEALKSLINENIVNAFQIYKLITKYFDEMSLRFGGKHKVAEIIKSISVYLTQDHEQQDLAKFTQEFSKTNNETILNILEEAYRVARKSRRCFLD